ncbi:MAG TPA: hypothetical protein VF714_05810 [Jatrophihabitans sp.]|jgi:hypothetical protein
MSSTGHYRERDGTGRPERLAASILRDFTDEDQADELADGGKDPAGVALGRRGGLKAATRGLPS